MLRTAGDSTPLTGDDLTEWYFTTSDVHPRDRFEYWFETSRRVLGPYENRPDQPTRFEGEIRHLRVQGMALSVFRCNGMIAWRTKRQTALLADIVHISSFNWPAP